MDISDAFEVSRQDKLKYFAIACLMCIIIGWLFYRTVVASAILCALPIFFYKKYRWYKEIKEKEKLNLQFKDVLYAFSDSVASGRQTAGAVNSSYESLKRIYGEENRLTVEFRQMLVRMRETNEAPDKILMDFAMKCGVEDIRNFMDVYCICMKSGGNKEKAIAKAAGIISDKINLRQELENILAQKKYEAIILCSLPPVVLLFLQLTSSGYADALYNGVVGRIVMSVCLAAALFAVSLCMKIMDIRI